MSDNLREITLDEVDKNLEASMKDLQRLKEDAQSFLDSNEKEEVISNNNVLQQQIEVAKKALDDSLKKALEEPEYQKKWLDGGRIPLNNEETPKNETSKNLVIDLEQYKKALYTTGIKTSVKKVRTFNTRKKAKIPAKQIAIYCVTVGVTVGVTLSATALAFMRKNAKIRQEALTQYREEILLPNTSQTTYIADAYGQMQPQKEPYIQNILSKLQEKYEDPLIAFYFYYEAFMMDDYYKNEKIESYVKRFNKVYGTDYRDFEDVIDKYGFVDARDYSNFVSKQVEALEEREEIEGRGI